MNRQLVSRLLRVIQEHFTHNNIPDNGVILYAGINECDCELFNVFIPKIKLNQFYYNCGKTFIIDRFLPLFNEVDGYIIFANGDICHIYKFESTFIKLKTINANLIKRQRKGGQSALRFSRLAEESRHEYVIRVIDYINDLCRNELEVPCYLFGSKEITKMILERSELLVKVINGGFLDFNDDTIKNTYVWLNYLKQNVKVDDTILEEIVLYLDTNVDMLDFDENNKDVMKFYLTKDMMDQYKDSTYYDRIKIFEYIGIKYYDYIVEDNEIIL